MTDRSRRPLGLYLHFPFCVRKCRYCDFLSFSAEDAVREAYLKRLTEELILQSPQYRNYRIETVFIGGGTPSLMTGQQLDGVMQAVFQYYDVSLAAEITVECNPGTVDGVKLGNYKASGVNRLSFGLQSMNDKELAYLGRIHTVRQFMDNYEAARQAGFHNINIDLMSALPGQTTDSWLESLQKAAALSPEHLSAYSLIIEEGTPFGEIYDTEKPICGKGILPLPDEDSEREMYHQTREVLQTYGYERYEISNYARKGYACRHNLTYWYLGDYLGVGLGAASLVGGRRFSNTSDLKVYMQHFEREETEILDQKARIEETMFLGLRCTSGISLKAFENSFGQSVKGIYGDVISRYTGQGLMICDEEADRLYLTEAGLDVSNWILSDFLL